MRIRICNTFETGHSRTQNAISEITYARDESECRFDTAEKRKSRLDESTENTRLKREGGKMNRNYIHDYKIKHKSQKR